MRLRLNKMAIPAYVIICASKKRAPERYRLFTEMTENNHLSFRHGMTVTAQGHDDENLILFTNLSNRQTSRQKNLITLLGFYVSTRVDT